jgi:hypothetical protein
MAYIIVGNAAILKAAGAGAGEHFRTNARLLHYGKHR